MIITVVVSSCCSLPREVQQPEDIDPERAHEVPVPCGHINHDATRFRRTVQPASNPGIEKSKNTADQVDGVDPGQDEEERTARIGSPRNVGLLQFVPGIPLSSEKSQPQENGGPDPGQGVVVADANAG